MSLLDKLWDDTVAGPLPDSGLGKLRKYSTFNTRSNSGGKESEVLTPRSFIEEANSVDDPGPRVTRSIMIVKPPGSQNKDSPPVSPAGTTPPVSPFAGAGGRFRRRSSTFSYDNASGIGPRSPRPPYDL